MPLPKKCLFFTLWITTLALPADSLLQQVKNRLLAIQPFRVQFVQQAFIDDEKEIEEKGEILFVNPSLITCRYLDPEKKTFLYRGDDYQFYDEESNQLVTGRISDDQKQFLWQQIFADLPPNTVSSDEKKRTIHITQGDRDASLDLMIRVGDDLLPSEATQHDPSGIKTLWIFRNYQSKIQVDKKNLEIRLPPDVRIIEEQ